MKAFVKFNQVLPRNLNKNDYIILKNNTIGKIAKIDKNNITIFIPKNSIEKQVKNFIQFNDVKYKLELWAYDFNNIPIAKISKYATFVKENNIIQGWVKKQYYSNENYFKIFIVKCPYCKHAH